MVHLSFVPSAAKNWEVKAKMNKNINKLLFTIAGTLIVIITICLFFLVRFEKTIVNYFGLFFCVLSEILILISFKFINKIETTNKVFVYSGVTVISVFYFIATSILCVLAGYFRDSLSTFILLEFVLLAISAMVFVLISYFTNRINNSEQKIIEDRKLMQICSRRIYNLLTDSKNIEYKEGLKQVYEKLTYCDSLGTSSIDEQIVGAVLKIEKLFDLSEPEKKEVEKCFKDITTFISQRNMEISENKRGGF